jgi:hypothetical protein
MSICNNHNCLPDIEWTIIAIRRESKVKKTLFLNEF